MSLLRAPLFPDPDCDQGHHRLQFSVRPGATIGDAVEEDIAATSIRESSTAPWTPSSR